ncbi:ATP-binding cassette domain-containing protein [Wohlfahrtiimonas larvae]|uniref:ABC-F family ATP-binding cassette domain-containing protein n=2 Tax=Wohlfahrtiimonas larvae TaxID=1157986 RepID=A0ABP9MSB0_9GAMM|nr:ATP-binding cassette domain-containing protein [Wohlfahrtiimonas larvae]
MSKFLQLNQLSYGLPNGNTVFSNLTYTFSQPITALIGRNGVGKSLLAQIMAGRLLPTEGSCINSDLVYYLSQKSHENSIETVAEALEIQSILDTLQRIENGSVDADDFEIVGSRWCIQDEALNLLAELSLSHVTLTTAMQQLSGGEQMRIRIAAAFLSQAQILILDEPSNHLDYHYKQVLWSMIQSWQGQVIIITHDRYLLNQVNAIVELSTKGLTAYSGAYQDYVEQRDAELASIIQQLNAVKQTEKKRLAVAQQQLERQAKRSSQANKQRSEQNQAKILLDRQKNRSELSSGKAKEQRDKIAEQGKLVIQSAKDRIDQQEAVVLHGYAMDTFVPKVLVELNQLVLPYLSTQLSKFHGQIEKGDRIAIVGKNGSGKSVLLKTLAGKILPLQGDVKHHVNFAYLEQLLQSYRGALVIVAHDQEFLENIGINKYLVSTEQGWQWQEKF